MGARATRLLGDLSQVGDEGVRECFHDCDGFGKIRLLEKWVRWVRGWWRDGTAGEVTGRW